MPEVDNLKPGEQLNKLFTWNVF